MSLTLAAALLMAPCPPVQVAKPLPTRQAAPQRVVVPRKVRTYRVARPKPPVPLCAVPAAPIIPPERDRSNEVPPAAVFRSVPPVVTGFAYPLTLAEPARTVPEPSSLALAALALLALTVVTPRV